MPDQTADQTPIRKYPMTSGRGKTDVFELITIDGGQSFRGVILGQNFMVSPTPNPTPDPTPTPTPSGCRISITNGVTITRIGTNSLTFMVGDTITVAGFPTYTNGQPWTNVNGVYKIIDFEINNLMVVECVTPGCFNGWPAEGTAGNRIYLGPTIVSSGGAIVASALPFESTTWSGWWVHFFSCST